MNENNVRNYLEPNLSNKHLRNKTKAKTTGIKRLFSEAVVDFPENAYLLCVIVFHPSLQNLTYAQLEEIKLSLFINYYVCLRFCSAVPALRFCRCRIVLVWASNLLLGSRSLQRPESLRSFALSHFFLYHTRFRYKRAMLVALGIIGGICFIMPSFPGFFAVKLLFVAIGACFALIKMSVYSTIGIITMDTHGISAS